MIEAALRCIGALLITGALARAALATEPVPLARVERREPPPPAAEPPRPKRLRWEPHQRFRPAQYAIAFGTPVLFRFVDFHTREAREPRWRGAILFDEPVRDWLRADGTGSRVRAARLSDWAWYASMAWPLLDGMVVALALDGNPDVAWQLAALSVQAYALTGFISLTTIRAVARERPATAVCRENPADPGCELLQPRAFPSGHTAGAFAGAGLVCSSHRHLPLYGSRWLDQAACIGALMLGASTGVLRVASDRHYATDVIIGAGLGLAAGWLLPELLSYRSPSAPGLALWLLPVAAPNQVSLAVAGSY
jgi:membrane-associated phospholipid phosphatase